MNTGSSPATAEQRLRQLGIKLPTPPEPFYRKSVPVSPRMGSAPGHNFACLLVDRPFYQFHSTVVRAALDQIFRGDVRVVDADEPLDVRRLGALEFGMDARNDRLEESVLRLVRARGHLRISLPGGV